jgi:ADP-ribose pyrophosphatase YjhB (NUDIX family)
MTEDRKDIKDIQDIQPKWLQRAREIQALSQTGLMYSLSSYDTERYKKLTRIAAEMIAETNGAEVEPYADVFYGQEGYATPKVDVRAAIVHTGKILLVKEVSDGKWAMPGGWADVGDVPSQAAERETWEESGYRVKAKRLVGVYDANRIAGPLSLFHAYKLVFLCELISGEARTSNETTAVDFFPFEELPELSVCRTDKTHIADAKMMVDMPKHPTVFD